MVQDAQRRERNGIIVMLRGPLLQLVLLLPKMILLVCC